MPDKGRFPPWSRIPSLQEMSQEAGINFDQLMEAFREQASVPELAARFGVSEAAMISLKEHFDHYGIASVMGGD